MSEQLVCRIAPRLDAVSAAQWERLFPDLPDSLEMIRLIQDCGVEGFRFHSITVWEGARPLLLLPLFETTYQFATLVDGRLQPLARALARWMPRLVSVRLLGVGFVESEWGQVGVDRGVPRPLLEAAWGEALRTLETLADGVGAALTAFVNFTEHSGRMLPMHQLKGFASMHGLPFARTPMTHANTERYIGTLSANMRSSLRRKLRTAREVRVVRTRDPGSWLEDIYRFYADTCQRSDVAFSRHGRAFFAAVCERIPEAQYALYFAGERLVGFRLQVVRPDCLMDKYFGMDPEIGRDYGLYFVSWVKDVEHCIANRIPLYHAGLTAEDTKARLGAAFVPTRILFKHRHRLLQRLLATLASRAGYRPAVALPPMTLGADWALPADSASASNDLPNQSAVRATVTAAYAAVVPE